MESQLSCYACGSTYTGGDRKRCECGEPLWFEMPDEPGTIVEPDRYGMWRYESVLPVSSPAGIGAGAGGTPLGRLDELDTHAGCAVYVKDESNNPTGSFKDRGSAVGVTHAIENDVSWVGTLSYGNMAMSVSATAASVGKNCVVIVPSKIPDVRFQMIGQYDPRIVRVDDFKSVNEKLADIESELEIEFINADVPLRVEGQKTVAYEIWDQMLPDAVVVPVASGGHASAIWKGFRELRRYGKIDEIPRLYFIQVEASEPIARAYRNGQQEVSPVETSDTAAVSIVNKAPLSGNRALAAARESGGAVLSVSEQDTLAATERFASEGGLCVEPASAVTLAGASTLSDRGEIDDGDDVVLVTTGTGFKELAGTDPGPTSDESNEAEIQDYLEALTT